ncbi:hypothetical protein ONZ45_g13305 [Pleurotus djamor]|nr:hypothetical protein ONZ45_g13305 [Pleurotus djamor]
MSAPTVEVPAQENLSIQVTEKSLSKEVSTRLSPAEIPNRQALLPTQDGVATDDHINNSVVASAPVNTQVEPAAGDEKQENDGGKKKAIAKTKKSVRIAQSKNKKQAEGKGQELTLPEGVRVICKDYSRLLRPNESVNAETASVTPANDAVVDEVKDVATTNSKTKKPAARRKSTANLRASSSKDDDSATQLPVAAVKKAGRVKGKVAVDNDVEAIPEPSAKTKKATTKKSVADTDPPAKPKPKAAKGKKVAAKKEVVPSISVRAPAAGKGKGKAKEIKLSRFAPVEEGSGAVKRKALEDDEATDELEDHDADDDGVRRPSKRAKVVPLAQ